MIKRLVAVAAVSLVFGTTVGQAVAASEPGWLESHSTAERDDIVNAMYLQTGHGPAKNPSRAAQATALADHLGDAGFYLGSEILPPDSHA